VKELLDEPRRYFDEFHDKPTEDSLAQFMDSFQERTSQVTELLFFFVFVRRM